MAGRGRGNIAPMAIPAASLGDRLQCVSPIQTCETTGTSFHAKSSSPELIVRIIAYRADALVIVCMGGVCEIDPHTVLSWLVEAAEQ